MPERPTTTVARWNKAHLVGTPVRVWTGAREGDGTPTRTRSAASVLGGHTAVVWVEGHGACIALTHVDPDHIARFPALAVACPACGSQPGALCTSHSGTRERRNDVHQARTRAYAAAQPLEPLMTTLDTVLTAGLRWLHEIEQPDDAWKGHHGLLLPAPAVNRLYGFVPSGYRQLPVITVEVAKVEWIDNGPGALQSPANPLEADELEVLSAELRARGYEVDTTWNGHPGITGSVGLAQPAHPSLVAAVDRYHAGCLAHPKRGVFCDCEAWRVGFTRIVRPELTPTAP